VTMRIWVEALNVFLAFFITLSLFPGVLLLIESHHGIREDRFAIALIFTFQVFDFFGRILTRFVKFPSARYLWIPSVGRFSFFAFFILAQQNRVFTSDYWTFAFDAAMALSNGYLGTLAVMYAPERVEDHEREAAGNIMAFMLNLGLFVGVHAALVLLKILTGSFLHMPVVEQPTPSPFG